MNQSYGGSFQKRFISSMDRLSKVSFFSKKITKEGPCYSGTRFLLNYNLEKQNGRTLKITLYLNTLTAAILYKVTYNYTLINLSDRKALKDSLSRLIYTLICLKAYPRAIFVAKIPISYF
uniref:hypothetical protein n=1 Tax=Gracilariopsis tenuifrons TaxID=31472 RepID=UPI001D12359E|nr:hypothetical protein LK036_mgp15 [Gracilariopsis tenuifrons]UAD89953.1 hypothetical protein [Gracilariopsis tenuifrons]